MVAVTTSTNANTERTSAFAAKDMVEGPPSASFYLAAATCGTERRSPISRSWMARVPAPSLPAGVCEHFSCSRFAIVTPGDEREAARPTRAPSAGVIARPRAGAAIAASPENTIARIMAVTPASRR